MTRGKFITIEGTEGAGKSTAIKYIRSKILAEKADCVFTREPGGTPIAEEIRKVLLFPASKEVMTPETELLLMFAGRAQHIHQCIEPALHKGKWVVSDRFVDASYAYQGGGRGISIDKIKTLDKLIVGHLYPDLTILLDVPADLGLDRTDQRGGKKDRIEHEKLEFFNRVREAYLERARQQPARIKRVDASQPLAAVQEQLSTILDDFIKRHV
jgi:dTMP kinase